MEQGMAQAILASTKSLPEFRASIVPLSCITVAILLSRTVHSSDICTLLADSAEQKDRAAVRILLDKGVDVNATQVDGMTAVHWAVYHDDLDMAKLLVAHKADVTVQNRYGVPPLSLACTNGNEHIVQLLLDAGADPNMKLRGGETTLMTAARTGRVGSVTALLAAGADVNASDSNEQTAIMWASAAGHAEVVQLLIEAKAEFLSPLDSGFTPLFFAVREGHTKVVDVLLAAGVDVNSELRPRSGARTQRTNALILAVENGHFETAVFLLEKGADPNAAPAGYTAIHAITSVRRPLRGDTDPAPIGSGNISSLEFVSRLLNSGANINAPLRRSSGSTNRYVGGNAQFGKSGATAFLLAARNSDVPLLRLLLKAGADWRIPNKDNCSALLAAAGVGALGSGDELPGTDEQAIRTVQLLLELGADINAVADHGETAMHGAAYHERPALVEFLVDHGADIGIWNRKNKFDWTPLMIARGHRPGNFRPSPKTIVAIEKVMRASGIEPPPDEARTGADQGDR